MKPTPITLQRGDARHAVPGAVYQMARNLEENVLDRAGQSVPISLDLNEDEGTPRLNILTGADGQPQASYRRRKNGTVSYEPPKGYEDTEPNLHGTHIDWWDLVKEQTAPILIDEIIGSEELGTLASLIAQDSEQTDLPANLLNAAHHLASHNLAAQTNSDSSGTQPTEIADLLAKALQKHIFQPEIVSLALQGAPKKLLTIPNYNIVVTNQDTFRKIAATQPGLISLWARTGAPIEEPTERALADTVAKALRIKTPNQLLALATGLQAGMWTAASPERVQKTCILAGMETPPLSGQMRLPNITPQALRNINALAEKLPHPHANHERMRHQQERTVKYWVPLLQIYLRDHQSAEDEEDTKWLDHHMKTFNKANAPKPFRPETDDWSFVKANADKND